MKTFSLYCAIITLPFSASSVADLMRFSFTGTITDISNAQQQYFDNHSLIGTKVTGEFILDTQYLVNGREETRYYWWWDQDLARPVLESFVTLGGNTYSLTNDYTYNEEFGEYVAGEFLEMTNGPDFDGGPVGDGQSLYDTEQYSVIDGDGERSISQTLQYRFTDYLNDFLTFPDGFEVPPDFTQTFVWEDFSMLDDEQNGEGSYRYYQSYFEPGSGVSTEYDCTVNFSLSRVTASRINVADVPAPYTALLMLSGAYLIRRRTHTS